MKSALMIIDVQIGLVELMPPKLQEEVLSKVRVLLHKARSSGVLVVFVQHDGPKGHPLEAETAPWACRIPRLPRCRGSWSSGRRRQTRFTKRDWQKNLGRARSNISS